MDLEYDHLFAEHNKLDDLVIKQTNQKLWQKVCFNTVYEFDDLTLNYEYGLIYKFSMN